MCSIRTVNTPTHSQHTLVNNVVKILIRRKRTNLQRKYDSSEEQQVDPSRKTIKTKNHRQRHPNLVHLQSGIGFGFICTYVITTVYMGPLQSEIY